MDTDWAYLERFKVENRILKTEFDENRIVFIGDSIIAGWNEYRFFADNPHHINRGINGQTTSQILHRFQQDVIDLKPKSVVVLVGTNDVAENNGPISLIEIENNFISMIKLASANQIKVILCSILPVSRYYWNTKIKPSEKIIHLNTFLANTTNNTNVLYMDFYKVLVKQNGFNKTYSDDGVHPNSLGYSILTVLFYKLSIEILDN